MHNSTVDESIWETCEKRSEANFTSLSQKEERKMYYRLLICNKFKQKSSKLEKKIHLYSAAFCGAGNETFSISL